MKKILIIDACPRKEASRTLLLLENIDRYGLTKEAEIYDLQLTRANLENLAQFITENMEGEKTE